MHDDGAEKRSSLEKGLLLYDLLLPDQWQSSKSLGEQIGVDQRTVKNYARLLMAYGWPILSQNGRGRGYKLDGVTPESLRFTPRDLFTLAILLAQGSTVLPSLEADKLKAKLRALLPEDSRSQVENLEELISAQGFAPRDWDLVEKVGTCLYDRKYSLVIEYKGRTDELPGRRQVLPLGIRSSENVLYLDLFDLDKRAHRSFRFDRIHRAVLLKQDRAYDEPPAESFEVHKWDFGSESFVDAVLEVSPGLAHWLMENPEHPSQTVREDEGRHYVAYRVRRMKLFADWVIGLRGARVVQPAKLCDLVRQRALAWLNDDGTLNLEWER